MLVLAFDTTTPDGSVALLSDGLLLGEVGTSGASSHSLRLFPAIDFLLRQLSLGVKDVDAFAVAAGPGSFTGIRVGLSTAKGLALSADKLIAAVSTLKALALKGHSEERQPVAAMVDARKGEVFAGLFKMKGGELETVVPEAAYKPDNFLTLLPKKGKISFIGSGAIAYREKIIAHCGERALFPSRSLYIAREVGLLGIELLREGKGVRPQELEPLYYRPSQAEEKRLSSLKSGRNS